MHTLLGLWDPWCSCGKAELFAMMDWELESWVLRERERIL
jgi:hypothetical protein